MAVTGVSNLTELISNQSLGQRHASVAGAQLVQAQNNQAAVLVQDTFTPSSQSVSNQATAQDAGIFQVSQIALPAATVAPAVPPATANANTVPLENTQIELQTLNGVLLGLGLTYSNIQQIDRIASLTKLYSPNLYNDLVEQFKAQAALQANLAVAAEPKAATE